MKKVVAFKTFDHSFTTLEFPHMRLNGSTTVKQGVWLKAEEIKIRSSKPYDRDGAPYISGFHAYTKQNRWVGRVKVYLRKVHTIGIQDHEKVLVAQEMYVPKERIIVKKKKLHKS